MKTDVKRSFRLIQPSIVALPAAAVIALALLPAKSEAQNIYYGAGALKSGSTTGLDDSAFGYDALYTSTNGTYDTAVGYRALKADKNGDFNTACGCNALLDNTSGGYNTAVGDNALLSNGVGFDNTAYGQAALSGNTSGSYNAATGQAALSLNTSGSDNTATGQQALLNNTTGSYNTATGQQALLFNTTGSYNTATGQQALLTGNGNGNTADGYGALYSYGNPGSFNVAIGFNALTSNEGAYDNTAVGSDALESLSTGYSNIAIGYSAAEGLYNGSNNIVIGSQSGSSGESNAIHIGVQGTQTATYIAGIYNTHVSGVQVYVDSDGQLGVAPATASVSPSHLNEEIKTMRAAMARLQESNDALKAALAEQAKRFASQEQISTQQQREQAKRFASQDQINAQEQREVAMLTASLKAQASLLQRVSAQIQVNGSAPQVVSNGDRSGPDAPKPRARLPLAAD
jgi:hypothetical protein